MSGGTESAALIQRYLRQGFEVHPAYIRGGHAWESAELHWTRRLLRRMARRGLETLEVLSVPVRDTYRAAGWSLTGKHVPSARTPDEAVYLPGRNILLLSKLAVFSAERGIGRIALGTLGTNPFPDATVSFFRMMETALSSGLAFRLKVETPLRGMHKPEVLKTEGVPWELTFSCIAPRGLSHCGRCNKCAERLNAFEAAGISRRK